MKMTDEVLNLIRFIKLNAFEKYYYKKMNTVRNLELNLFKKK